MANRNPFIAMAVMVATFAAAYRENAMHDFYTAGGKPRRSGRGEAGGYGKGLRKQFAAKNLARRANGKKMVAA